MTLKDLEVNLLLYLLVTSSIADCTCVALRQPQATSVLVGFVGDGRQWHRKVEPVGHVDCETQIFLHVHQWQVDMREASVDHC